MAVDGEAVAAHVYEIRYQDIKQPSEARPGQPFIRPKGGRYFIRCGGDGAVPPNVEAMVGEAIALDTEGQHCACAVHAVFGAPAVNGKLLVLGARRLARQLLSQAARRAGSSASIHRRLHFLVQTFWEEYMLRHFRQEPTGESRLFWEALRKLTPVVAEESRQKYQEYQGRLDLVQAAKTKVLRDSQLFFTEALEPFIRSLANEIGYMPSPDMMIDGESFEGLEPVCGTDGVIRGSKRVRILAASRMSKYDALFHQNEVFNALRESFLVFGDPHMTPQRVLHAIRGRLRSTEAVPQEAEMFSEALAGWVQAGTVDQRPPPSFFEAAWPAYLECIQSTQYFFSTTELAMICDLANVNVAIFRQIDETLSYVEGVFGNAGRIVCVKLLSNNVGEVHSHFERVLTKHDVLEFMIDRDRDEAANAPGDASEDRSDNSHADCGHDEAARSSVGATCGKSEAGNAGDQPKPASSEKAAKPDALIPRASFYNVLCMPCNVSPDPRAALERELELLAQQIREHPTLPADTGHPTLPMREAFDDTIAAKLPSKHCAFKGCCWSLPWCAAGERPLTERQREFRLVEHVTTAHNAAVAPAASLLPSFHSGTERVAAVYNEALAIRARQAAPIASYAIDRKCLRKGAEAMAGDNIQSLICFLCACEYPYRRQDSETSAQITWQQPCNNPSLFLTYSRADAEYHFSLESYLQKYAQDPLGFYDLRRHLDDFDDWVADVPFAQEYVRIICCPEDRTCTSAACRSSLRLCQHCSVPVCKMCRAPMTKQVLPHTGGRRACPPGALANDMMIFYPTRELHTDGGLTVMEMICASPCLTSMICFSMEVKYGNMFDSLLNMQRHRVGARGNATTFLLPFESLLGELERLDQESASNAERCDLPRSGHQLRYVVQVLLKTNDEEKRDNLKHFIHQARVRQHKVIEVILAMKRVGHRAYANVNEAAVVRNAANLPVNGIPPELVSLLPNDKGFEKMRVQKAATPVEGMASTLEAAANRFKHDRPNAVVLERSAAEEGDVKVRQASALKSLVEMLDGKVASENTDTGASEGNLGPKTRLTEQLLHRSAEVVIKQLAVTYLNADDMHRFICTSHEAGNVFGPADNPGKHLKPLREQLKRIVEFCAGMRRVIVATGSKMQNQFVPWYFGVAFAFVFKYCTAMPDMPVWSQVARHKRTGDAPRVELPLWTRLLTRRVEQQVQRDWLFGFTMSSVLFHSQLNQCRTVYSYEKCKREDGSSGFSAEDLESAAIEICRRLDGTYVDVHGRRQKVNGDFTKLRHIKDLSEASKRLLQNLEHTGRQLKGTMEVRKMMRFQTHAGRIRRGVPIFITFSPDEKHNMLMLRLYRARENDPIHKLDGRNLRYGRRLEPCLDHDYVEMGCRIDALADTLPTYDERRAILSRSPLASVDGFWVTVFLVCEYVLGLRVCPECPGCNHMSTKPEDNKYQVHCQDLFGNSAYSDGGCFGRGAGLSLSVESQKSQGALHGHGQLHIQCLHQHLPLAEVMTQLTASSTRGLLCYPANFPQLYIPKGSPCHLGFRV